MDDMLVKSKTAEEHIEHLNKMLNILQKYRMKLNPIKYAFGAGRAGQVSRLYGKSTWDRS